MQFSLVATFSGIANDVHYWPCDVTYDDIRRACEECGIPYDETENGDSEYLYCCDDSFNRESFLESLASEIAADTGAALPDDDDRGHEWALEFVREHSDDDTLRDFDYWHRFAIRGRDLTIGTIVDRDTFTRFVDAIGAFAEDCQTLGTLGGPLSDGFPSIVPDVPFRMESSAVIESIRVTPFPSFEAMSHVADRPESWERVRSAVLSVYGC